MTPPLEPQRVAGALLLFNIAKVSARQEGKRNKYDKHTYRKMEEVTDYLANQKNLLNKFRKSEII